MMATFRSWIGLIRDSWKIVLSYSLSKDKLFGLSSVTSISLPSVSISLLSVSLLWFIIFPLSPRYSFLKLYNCCCFPILQKKFFFFQQSTLALHDSACKKYWIWTSINFRHVRSNKRDDWKCASFSVHIYELRRFARNCILKVRHTDLHHHFTALFVFIDKE